MIFTIFCAFVRKLAILCRLERYYVRKYFTHVNMMLCNFAAIQILKMQFSTAQIGREKARITHIHHATLRRLLLSVTYTKVPSGGFGRF